MLKVFTYQQTPFRQNCRIIFNHETLNAIVCDMGSAEDAPFIYKECEKYNFKVKAILLTHGHIDHCGGADNLAELLHVPIVGPHKADEVWLNKMDEQAKMFRLSGVSTRTPNISHFVTDNEKIDFALGEEILCIHCPGHTPGHMCYYMMESKMLLAGDVLFAGSVGRCDFTFGDPEALLHSIKNKLFMLPDETQVLTGHGPDTTIMRERMSNPYLLNFC